MTLSSTFSETGFLITITPLLLASLLLLLLAVWIVFTLIVRYHWKNYGARGAEALTMNFIYFSGSAILIAFTVVSVILYSTSGQ